MQCNRVGLGEKSSFFPYNNCAFPVLVPSMFISGVHMAKGSGTYLKFYEEVTGGWQRGTL